MILRTGKGFTLMEMIVVMAIIAVILGLSTPFFSRFTSRTRLKSAVREISGLLSSARNNAITHRLKCKVIFDLENNEYWMENQKTSKRRKLPSGIQIVKNSFDSNQVIFIPTGGLSTPTGSITVSDRHGFQKEIEVVGTTGKVRVK